MARVHPDLEQAIEFHDAIMAESGKALVGYETAKTLANIVLRSEIPTTGNLLLRGVPAVGKTFFGVILAAIRSRMAGVSCSSLARCLFERVTERHLASLHTFANCEDFICSRKALKINLRVQTETTL